MAEWSIIEDEIFDEFDEFDIEFDMAEEDDDIDSLLDTLDEEALDEWMIHRIETEGTIKAMRVN